MLTRRNRRIAVAVAAIMVAALAVPGAAAADTPRASSIPAAESACPVNALAPCVASAAVPARGPGFALGNQALAPAAAAPLLAAAPPAVKAPFFSDQFCSYASIKLNCTSALLGYYDPLDNCYWNQMVPQPPAGDPLWQGHTGGALYTVVCETHFGTNIGNAGATVQWSATPPLNYAQPTPFTGTMQLVAIAVNLLVTALALAPIPVIRTEPPASGGVVGLPVWMWSEIPPILWNQQSLNKNLVAFSFKGQQVDWDMGDGHHVICSTPGSAYTAPNPLVVYKTYSGPPGPSPDCGYRYQTAGTYGVTATITWYAAFALGTTTGTFVLTRTTKIQMLSIGELQAVTK